MKHWTWHLKRHPALSVLLILLCVPLYVIGAPNVNGLWTNCLRSVPRSFTQSQQEQLCTGNHIRQDPTAPGQCAKLALGGRPLQAARFASRIELLRGAVIIQLCSGVSSTGPAKCWLAISAQERQQMLVSSSTTNDEVGVDSTAAVLPLVQVCRHARDDHPAKCVIVWFELSKTLSRRDTYEALETVIAICSAFRGLATALKQCVKQTQPHLSFGANSQINTLQLCRFIGDGTNLSDVVQCASMLGKKRIPPSTISEVCAEASGNEGTLNRHPHTCFLEAKQKLRWMTQDAQISLCKDAVANADMVPIDCAVEMKVHTRTLLPSTPSYSPTVKFGKLVANLCRRATNATAVIECVRLLPAHIFTTDQTLRLCAASTMPVEHSEDGGLASLYPTSCAMKARLLLQRALSVDGSNDMDMTASAAAVKVCEQSTSDAPSKCLADTQYDQALSAKLRVQLCQRAMSDAPYLCFKSLRRFINSQRLDIHDAVTACRQTVSLGPAECVTEFLRAAPGTTVAQLCRNARNLEPARCFRASPQFYDDELKVSLCAQAESTAPASCVESVITRIGNQPSAKVALCRGATTSAPAACAIEAPFSMDEANVIVLCRSAANIAPARCAQEVPISLGVPWHLVAQVCEGATSITPGRCLAYHIRHSRLLLRPLDTDLVVRECRIAMAQPAALGIAHASYNCPELRTMCPLQLVLNVVDQYGNYMTDGFHHQAAGNTVVYVSAVFTGRHGQQYDYIRRQQPAMHGPSYASIVNGSATFSNLLFTGAGEFTLTFRAGEGVTEEVARVLVHPDHEAEALKTRCDELFTRFQCIVRSPASPTQNSQQRNMQMLLLPVALHFSAISCGQYWFDNVGGLSFSNFYPPHSVLFALPRPLYDLFTSNMDMPSADMNPWTLLGLDEGETNRAAIRRAYHRRSLEWHPDKWHALAANLPAAWQQELGGAYALVTQAYDYLTKS